MNSYDTVMKFLSDGKLKKLSIAVMAVIFWIIRTFKMSDDNIESVMEALGDGFEFNTTTAILTFDGAGYDIYQMLEYSIANLYKKVDLITYLVVSSGIKFAHDMEYITSTERDALKDLLNAA